MADEIHVIIIEDDPFARNWMTLLTARDWRTKVMGDFDAPDKLGIFFKQNPLVKVDVIVVDTETSLGGDWIQQTFRAIQESRQSARILCTGIEANERTLRKLSDPVFVGYILKGEIPYSIAWAINLTMQGMWVTTSKVQLLAAQKGIELPPSCTILDGHESPFRLTNERQAREARLAILFSMERHELADELGIAEGWSYGKVRDYYIQMGLKEILTDDSDLEDYLAGENLILSYLEEMKEDYSGSGKTKWMETMAFHLLTMPKVERINR